MQKDGWTNVDADAYNFTVYWNIVGIFFGNGIAAGVCPAWKNQGTPVDGEVFHLFANG